jgi:lipopolysaccharide export system ATP-binding protein
MRLLWLHLKAFAEIELAANWVVYQEILCSLTHHPAFVDEIGTIDDRKGLAHIVVGDQDGEAGFAQVDDKLLHVIDRDRIDEPFSGVDPIAVYDVQQIVVNLRKSGLAILITDHNVRETLSIVDRAYLIFEGRVESEGTKDFLINDPISRQLYLGERFQM